ncbi:MAG TPA: AAA family ATPase, partial [Acidobacteriota bacterium]|nr:AAA family ATPase [Acidobacteriota bacterium]
QTELWMRELIPDLEIRALTLPGVTAAALRFRKRGHLDDWVRPANMGFGVSYTLPIIVAGLLARPGHMLVVENPEAHLHPQGQSRIGRFLALLAAKGVQVLIETHSDHVLNGIRLAATDEHPLQPENVLIHFFTGRGQGEAPIAEAITLTRRELIDLIDRATRLAFEQQRLYQTAR